MQKQTVSLIVPDGGKMNAYAAFPAEKNSFPAVIIFQEAFGVNHHIRNIVERIAGEGYVAVAPELFHRTAAPGFEGSYEDFNSVKQHTQAVKIEGLTADIQTVYGWLQLQKQVIKNKIGCLGFCMGGRVSFIANALLPLSAAVSYYGGNMPSVSDKAKELHAPHLFFWGGLDKHILPEHIDSVIKAMKEAGKEYINVTVSYADHGFNCDERSAYQPKAAKETWAMTLAFLRNNLLQ